MRGSCVIFGGSADYGLYAGSFYLSANNGTSYATGYIGSGVLLHKTSTTSPCLQVGRTKNYAPLCVGREIESSGVKTRQ